MQKLFAVLSLVSALAFAQIPEVVQQYRQRIGGAVDELNVVVRNFDEDSRRSGYERASAIGEMMTNPVRLVREQGQRIHDYARRLDRLRSQQSALTNGVTLDAILAVAFNYDQQTMSQTWNTYTWSLPMTVIGILFAIIGWVFCYGTLLLFGLFVTSRSNIAA